MGTGGKSFVYFVGTFPPRECGIATFTKDLTDAFDRKFNPGVQSRIVAMNENGSATYNYPEKVNIQIDESDMESYLLAAEDLNKCRKTRLVNIQHEFGIFGGSFGDYLIPFLEELKKPSIITYHSVLPMESGVSRHMRYVARKLSKLTNKTIAISGFGKEILTDEYGIPERKITVIPHGIPNVAFGEEKAAKKELGLEENIVISTFGLLSSKKGVQYVIRALPELVKKYPNILYLIIGETHPIVRREEGEQYRNKLRKLAARLGLKKNVKFYNKYLTLDEIIMYLQATDIYITHYYDPYQISSGTLAYAVGSGKACISTPYLYARDVLRHDRGLIVGFKRWKKIQEAIDFLLSKPRSKRKFERRAYAYSRSWVWPKVAESYMHTFNQVLKNKG